MVFQASLLRQHGPPDHYLVESNVPLYNGTKMKPERLSIIHGQREEKAKFRKFMFHQHTTVVEDLFASPSACVAATLFMFCGTSRNRKAFFLQR